MRICTRLVVNIAVQDFSGAAYNSYKIVDVAEAPVFSRVRCENDVNSLVVNTHVQGHVCVCHLVSIFVIQL